LINICGSVTIPSSVTFQNSQGDKVGGAQILMLGEQTTEDEFTELLVIDLPLKLALTM